MSLPGWHIGGMLLQLPSLEPAQMYLPIVHTDFISASDIQASQCSRFACLIRSPYQLRSVRYSLWMGWHGVSRSLKAALPRQLTSRCILSSSFENHCFAKGSGRISSTSSSMVLCSARRSSYRVLSKSSVDGILPSRRGTLSSQMARLVRNLGQSVFRKFWNMSCAARGMFTCSSVMTG